MATQTWIAGRIGAWFTAANWTSGIVPSTGDAVIVGSGMPEIDSRNNRRRTHHLGRFEQRNPPSRCWRIRPSSSSLVVAGEVAVEQSLTITGGDPASHVTAHLAQPGRHHLRGPDHRRGRGWHAYLDAESFGATSGNFTSRIPPATPSSWSPRSSLHFEGEAITTAGVIEVEGFIDVAAGVGFGGNGIVMLDDGGQMSIAGTVGADVAVDFADGSGKLTIADAAGFQGTIGFTNLAGDRIDLTGVLAQSERVDAGVLRPFSGPKGTGTEVAHLKVQMVDPEFSTPPVPRCRRKTSASPATATAAR